MYTATAVLAAIDVAGRKVATAERAVEAVTCTEQKEERVRQELTRALAAVKRRLGAATESAGIHDLVKVPAVTDALTTSRRAIESGE